MKDPKIQRPLLISLMKKSKENSKRLLDESKALYDQGMYATSVFLSITALEELGKTYLCHLTEVTKGEVSEKEFKDFTKKFKNHKGKEFNAFFGWFIHHYPKGEKLPENISKLWDLIADDNLAIYKKRGESIYVDYDLGNMSAVAPSENLKQGDAKYFLETVQLIYDRVYVFFS